MKLQLGRSCLPLIKVFEKNIFIVIFLDLESLTTDREVIRLKQNLAREFSVQVYNGMWNSPEAQFTRKTIDSSQTFVNGTVKIQLYKGFARVIARSSPTSVYDATLASMDELTGIKILLFLNQIQIFKITIRLTQKVLSESMLFV